MNLSLADLAKMDTHPTQEVRHPNKKLADAGEKLYYYEHVAMQEEKPSNESQTATKQNVDLDQENFEQVEAQWGTHA